MILCILFFFFFFFNDTATTEIYTLSLHDALPISMGIGTILEARKILLLATGRAKSAAIAKSIEGPITSAVSASALQLHPDVTFIIDDAAASELTQRDYYHRVLEMTALLTPDRLS